MESRMRRLRAEFESIDVTFQHAQLAVDGAHRARELARDTRRRAAALREEAHRLRGFAS